MSLGEYLKKARTDLNLTLRGVEQIAKEQQLGAELSSGYLSMLENGAVKTPSPKILYALAKIFDENYIELMRKAGYIPDDVDLGGLSTAKVAFKGASRLSEDSQKRIQRMIAFELSEERKRDKKAE